MLSRIRNGAISSLITYSVITPFDTIKVIMQNSQRSNIRSLGIRGLYRGYTLSLVSIIPAKALYLILYDTMRIYTKNEIYLAIMSTAAVTLIMNPIFYARTMRRLDMMFDVRKIYAGIAPTLIGGTLKNFIFFSLYNKYKGTHHPGLVSGICGFIATMITYPHETIRTRLRSGTPILCGNLYAGILVQISRTVPKNIVLFTLYEWLKLK